jgi:hypothetical protein
MSVYREPTSYRNNDNERKIGIAQRICSNLFYFDPPDQCEVSFAASEHIQSKDLSQWLIDVSDGADFTY